MAPLAFQAYVCHCWLVIRLLPLVKEKGQHNPMSQPNTDQTRNTYRVITALRSFSANFSVIDLVRTFTMINPRFLN